MVGFPVYLVAWNTPELGQFLGTGTAVVRYVPPSLVILATAAGYAPYQKRWLGTWLADPAIYPDLSTAVTVAQSLCNTLEEP